MDSSTGAVDDSTAKHLPECECYGRNHGECALCICDRLRACEQRVREEESRNVIGSVSLAAIGEANLQQYQLGFSEGLDAARDAVVALCQHPKSMPNGWLCSHALAASTIDALREDQK